MLDLLKCKRQMYCKIGMRPNPTAWMAQELPNGRMSVCNVRVWMDVGGSAGELAGGHFNRGTMHHTPTVPVLFTIHDNRNFCQLGKSTGNILRKFLFVFIPTNTTTVFCYTPFEKVFFHLLFHKSTHNVSHKRTIIFTTFLK